MNILGKKTLFCLSYSNINTNICFAQQYLIRFLLQKQLKDLKVYLNSQVSLTHRGNAAHHGRKGIAVNAVFAVAAIKWLHCGHAQGALRRMLALRFLSPSFKIQFETSAHGMVHSTFRIGPTSSVKSLGTPL